MKDATDVLPIHGVEHLSVLAILFLLYDKQCSISRCQLICLLSTRNNSRVYGLRIPGEGEVTSFGLMLNGDIAFFSVIVTLAGNFRKLARVIDWKKLEIHLVQKQAR